MAPAGPGGGLAVKNPLDSFDRTGRGAGIAGWNAFGSRGFGFAPARGIRFVSGLYA